MQQWMDDKVTHHHLDKLLPDRANAWPAKLNSIKLKGERMSLLTLKYKLRLAIAVKRQQARLNQLVSES